MPYCDNVFDFSILIYTEAGVSRSYCGYQYASDSETPDTRIRNFISPHDDGKNKDSALSFTNVWSGQVGQEQYQFCTEEIFQKIQFMPSCSFVDHTYTNAAPLPTLNNAGSPSNGPFFSDDIGLSVIYSGDGFWSNNSNATQNNAARQTSTGSITFKQKYNAEDPIKKIKFWGQKVCDTLGIPEAVWLHIDDVRISSDGEHSFTGDITTERLTATRRLNIPSVADVSGLPFKIHYNTAEKFARWIDWEVNEGTQVPYSPKNKILIGYGRDTTHDYENFQDTAHNAKYRIATEGGIGAGTLTPSFPLHVSASWGSGSVGAIFEQGKVGIGTTEPLHPLVVDGSTGEFPTANFISSGDGNLLLNDSCSGGGETAIKWGGSGRISGEGGVFNIQAYNKDIVFWRSDSQNSGESARISSSGAFEVQNGIIGTLMTGGWGAPDGYIFRPSNQYVNQWGIHYNQGTPDWIEFKDEAGVRAKIALDNGSAGFGLDGVGRVHIGTGPGNYSSAKLHIDNGSNTIGGTASLPTAAVNAGIVITGSVADSGMLAMDSNEIVSFNDNLFISVQGNHNDDGNIFFRSGIDTNSSRVSHTISSSGHHFFNIPSSTNKTWGAGGFDNVGSELVYIQGESNTTGIEWPFVIKNPGNADTSLEYGVGMKFKLGSPSEPHKWGGIACINAGPNAAWANDIDMVFYTGENGAGNYSEKMRIGWDGRVGINDTTPSQYLSVRGNASIGADNTVNGANSVALGSANAISHSQSYPSVCAGYENAAWGTTGGCFAGGRRSKAGSYSMAYGYEAHALGSYSSAHGYQVRNIGGYSHIFGISALNHNNHSANYEFRVSGDGKVHFDGGANTGASMSVDLTDDTSTIVTAHCKTTGKAEVIVGPAVNGSQGTGAIVCAQSISSGVPYTGGGMSYNGDGSPTYIDVGEVADELTLFRIHQGTKYAVQRIRYNSATTKFVGDVVAYATSDIRLKENIRPIESALFKINKLNGVYFNWKNEDELDKAHLNDNRAGKKDVGLIAQDVKKVLPEVIKERDEGYLAVNYEKIVPLLIQGIKEQQEQIDELKQEVKKLKGE